MATVATAALGFKSQAGGVSDVQNATLTANTTVNFVVGVRQIIGISVQSGTTDTNGSTGVHMRFALGSNATANATTDFYLAGGFPPTYFDTGEEFDRVAVISAGTPNVFVSRMNRAT